MKRFSLFLLLILFVCLSGFLFWFKSKSSPPSSISVEKKVIISKGSSASEIGKKLKKAGVVRDTFAFKFYVQLTDNSKKIAAGEYSIPGNLTLFQLVEFLKKGPREIWITIPEGLRREEIADKYVKSLGLEGEEGKVFKKEFLEFSKSKEGYLFPDTYLFPKRVPASSVINTMLTTFEKRVTGKMKEDIKSRGLDLEEVVIMASIVEREAAGNAERPIVAGILWKRIKAGWPLQVDATVQYVVATERCRLETENCNWWPVLTKNDLAISSPFNTYKRIGLPPYPVSNPGLSSIEGAIYHGDTPYWYYLHGEDRSIHYAKTLEEHNENIRKYLGR